MTISRREFVAGLSGLSVLSLCSESAFAEANDYKALVCIYLRGGNDGFNMVMPFNDEHYDQYRAARGIIACKRDELLSIPQTCLDREGRRVGLSLHPAMKTLQPLFERHNATAVINSGILQEELRKEALGGGAQSLPPQLFSHNSQAAEWHRGGVGAYKNLGWAGRMMDLLSESNNAISPLYSFSGNKLLLRSSGLSQNILNGGKALKLKSMDSPLIKRSYMKMIQQQNGKSAFHQTIQDTMQEALQTSESIAKVIDNSKSFEHFPKGRFAEQLHAVAKIIAQHKKLSQRRQVFYVSLSGFDTHDDQMKKHPALLKELSDGMSAFVHAMDALKLNDSVTQFTMSDFGRRIAPNDTGTDHGWGSHQLIVGGAIKEKQAVGQWPDLTLDGEDDISKGRVIPTTAADQVGATLARWMGITTAKEMRYVFPNIGNFSQGELNFL